MTPMTLLRGAAAGVVATAVMTGALALAKKTGFLGEPPPRKIMRRTLQKLLGRRPPSAVTNAAALAGHFGYGAATGALYALLPKTSLLTGALFGLGVYASSYLGWLPALGLMPRARHDRSGRQPSMVVAHLVFGTSLAEALRASRRFV